MTTININVPSSVWYDYLDPHATAMESDLELDQLETRQIKRGRGFTVRYLNVPSEVAKDLMDYLEDRAWVCLSNGDYENRHAHYQARKVADTIREALR